MLNTCTIQGRLTKDPHLNDKGQTSIITFTLACDRDWKDKNGNVGTDFIRCIGFGKRAETMANFFQKGQRVIVSGRWQSGSYQDQSGQTRYTNDLAIQSFNFDDSSRRSRQQSNGQSNQSQGMQVDDLPFSDQEQPQPTPPNDNNVPF